MSESPREPGMTPGDPLSPGPETPRHDSGLPAPPPAEPSTGYSSPPPPGAFGASAYAATSVPAAGRYTLASWWSRVGAQLLDGVILLVGFILLLILFGSVFSVGFFADNQSGVASVIVGLVIATLAFTIVSLLYAPLMMARTNGKTLGRMAVGIRVVRAKGEPMTFGFAMLREVAVKGLLLGIAGSITFGLANLADVLWPLWDDENRALHDFVVDTRVIAD